MMIPLWSVPLFGGVGHLSPYIISVILPREKDGRIGEVARTNLRIFIDLVLNDEHYRKLKNTIYVIIPDNIGLATIYCLFHIATNRYSITADLLPILSLECFFAIAALHYMRVLSYSIAAPISEKTPYIGNSLKSFFQSLGPSELRGYTVQEKFFHYLSHPDNWVTKRELRALDPIREIVDNERDHPPTFWEKILFRIFTGLDLQKVRKYCNSANINNAHLDLEAYWVDRELSIHIKNLSAVENIFQKLFPDIRGNSQNSSYPVDLNSNEYKLSNRAKQRLKVSYKHLCSHPKYKIPLYDFFNTDKGIAIREKKNPTIDEQTLEEWTYHNLIKCLNEDIERRKEDPNCQLNCITNEAYERALVKRGMVVSAGWVAAAAAVIFCSSVFFYPMLSRSQEK